MFSVVFRCFGHLLAQGGVGGWGGGGGLELGRGIISNMFQTCCNNVKGLRLRTLLSGLPRLPKSYVYEMQAITVFLAFVCSNELFFSGYAFHYTMTSLLDYVHSIPWWYSLPEDVSKQAQYFQAFTCSTVKVLSHYAF